MPYTLAEQSQSNCAPNVTIMNCYEVLTDATVCVFSDHRVVQVAVAERRQQHNNGDSWNKTDEYQVDGAYKEWNVLCAQGSFYSWNGKKLSLLQLKRKFNLLFSDIGSGETIFNAIWVAAIWYLILSSTTSAPLGQSWSTWLDMKL